MSPYIVLACEAADFDPWQMHNSSLTPLVLVLPVVVGPKPTLCQNTTPGLVVDEFRDLSFLLLEGDQPRSEAPDFLWLWPSWQIASCIYPQALDLSIKLSEMYFTDPKIIFAHCENSHSLAAADVSNYQCP